VPAAHARAPARSAYGCRAEPRRPRIPGQADARTRGEEVVRRASRSLMALGALAVLLGIAGCSKSSLPTEAQMFAGAPPQLTDPIPEQSTPAATLLALAWRLNHENGQHLAELLADDYQFAFEPGDSSGNPFAGRVLLRPDEISIEQHLFETGTATEPP